MKFATPFVTLKSAITLDGKTATVAGKSKWITSEEARLDVHTYRHSHDAILVGIGTVLADDPSLTTRLPNGGINPIRIVLDRQLRIPPNAKLVQDEAAPTWVITTEQAPSDKRILLQQLNVKVITLKEFTITSILRELGQCGILSVFVEGGAEINGSFLKERMVNQVITYVAPKLFGGKLAPTSIGGEGFLEVEEALELEMVDVTKIGEDIKIISRLKEGS